MDALQVMLLGVAGILRRGAWPPPSGIPVTHGKEIIE
jgi:hypothetical protein